MKNILNITLATSIAFLSFGQIKAQEATFVNNEPSVMSVSTHQDVLNEMSSVVSEATSFFPNFKYSFTNDENGAPVAVKIKGVNDKIAKSMLEAQLLDLEMMRIAMMGNTSDKLLVRADKNMRASK